MGISAARAATTRRWATARLLLGKAVRACMAECVVVLCVCVGWWLGECA